MSRGMGSLAGLYGNFVIYYFYSERKQGKYAVNPAEQSEPDITGENTRMR